MTNVYRRWEFGEIGTVGSFERKLQIESDYEEDEL